MNYPKIPLAQTVVELCKAKEIKHIVISPGSRNAPLTIGFTNDTFFTCYSIVDERCAAFFALGIAQQTQKPVAVVCTSGSALLNYYPAVAEAFYSDIPLVVLSADRPKYLVNIGDGQTITQPDVYGKHVLYSANLKQDIKEEKQEMPDLPIFKSIEDKLGKFLGLQQTIQQENETEINKAINKALVEKGPVHINIPFDEPLYDLVDTLSVSPKVMTPEFPDAKTNPDSLNELVNIWNTAKKKLVLVGVLQPNTIEQKWLEALANDDSIIVLTETTSNLHHEAFFPSIDKLIMPLSAEELKQLQPDLLLTFGGMIVSKKIKRFLRDHKPTTHWHVDEKKAYDTFFALSNHLLGNSNTFLSQLLPKANSQNSSYKSMFSSIMKIRREKHEQYLNEIQFCDFSVFDAILKTIPDNSQLQIGNSSAIRYIQLFDCNSTLKIFCNRGTSGIDGSTSTAIGAALVSDEPTVFITGDLSFFYDSNALWNNYIKSNFRIIVINNEGGGIFRILPGQKDTKNFDTYFETKHQLNAKHLCNMFQFEYTSAKNEKELENALNTFYATSEKPKLLEVFTPSTINDEVLLNYFKFIK